MQPPRLMRAACSQPQRRKRVCLEWCARGMRAVKDGETSGTPREMCEDIEYVPAAGGTVRGPPNPGPCLCAGGRSGERESARLRAMKLRVCLVPALLLLLPGCLLVR